MGRRKFVPFSRALAVGEESRAVAEALESGAFAGRGRYTLQAEGRLSEMHGDKPVVLTNSGSTALFVALLSFDLRPGDKVIVPSFGFVAVAQAVALVGCSTVFVDVDSATGSLSAASLEECRDPAIRGLVVIHYGGFAADMERIQRIATDRGWFVVEDAAHGLDGAHSRGALGTFGEVGILSFDHQKNIQCGEGGAVVINDLKRLETVRTIVNLGTNSYQLSKQDSHRYDWVSAGVKGYPPDYVAAILLSQLAAKDRIQQCRREQSDYYSERLTHWAEHLSILLPVRRYFASQPSWHIYWLTFPDSLSADSFIHWMDRAGVECKKHYSSLALLTKGREHNSGPTPASDHLAACLVRLPLGLHLTSEELDYVVAIALSWEGVNS